MAGNRNWMTRPATMKQSLANAMSSTPRPALPPAGVVDAGDAGAAGDDSDATGDAGPGPALIDGISRGTRIRPGTWVPGITRPIHQATSRAHRRARRGGHRRLIAASVT